LRGTVAVVGVGETEYYKWGQSPDPEFVLTLKAVLAACQDAGISPSEIDGFSSYSNDRSEASRLAAALGINDLRFAAMQWGGGGGGTAAAVANASAAIATGQAECVVVLRALAQGQFGRFGQGSRAKTVSGPAAFTLPYGLMSAAHMFAMRVNRFMHDHGVGQEALRAVALASYQHAQNNPRALMCGRPLDEAGYDASRWIVEPFHLFDCCQENDGAAAMVLVPAERAKDFAHRPCYVLGAVSGSHHRAGGVVMAMVEHGFCTAEEVNEFFRVENLTAPAGRLPLNTSGGNLAEAYMHGLGLTIEAVRQVWGHSTNQVPDVDVSMMIAGPMVTPVSSCVFGSEATL